MIPYYLAFTSRPSVPMKFNAIFDANLRPFRSSIIKIAFEVSSASAIALASPGSTASLKTSLSVVLEQI